MYFSAGSGTCNSHLGLSAHSQTLLSQETLNVGLQDSALAGQCCDNEGNVNVNASF